MRIAIVAVLLLANSDCLADGVVIGVGFGQNPLFGGRRVVAPATYHPIGPQSYGGGLTRRSYNRNVTWYTPAGGYAQAPQTGLPWRGGSMATRMESIEQLRGASGSVARRSRPASAVENTAIARNRGVDQRVSPAIPTTAPETLPVSADTPEEIRKRIKVRPAPSATSPRSPAPPPRPASPAASPAPSR